MKMRVWCHTTFASTVVRRGRIGSSTFGRCFLTLNRSLPLVLVQVAWAPAGTAAAGRIVVASSEGTLYGARVAPGTAEVVGPITTLCEAMVGAAAWSPDGTSSHNPSVTLRLEAW
jgi:hypothetical protein